MKLCIGVVFLVWGLPHSKSISDKSYRDWLNLKSFPDKSLDIPDYETDYDEENPITSSIRFMSGDIKDEVTFTLYTKDAPNQGTVIPINSEILKASKFDPNKNTKFITHGFLSSGKSDTCQEIKNAYLKYQDVNMFVTDWSGLAGNQIYFFPAQDTKNVGSYFAKFIEFLISNGLDPMKIHLIGHSLGAHVSGFAGAGIAPKKVCRITGLDPALPSFGRFVHVEGRLSSEKAEFVDVIHTSGGTLGIKESIGDADFFPNKGTIPQPGCTPMTNDIAFTCSHGMSWKLFAESINPDVNYTSLHCESYDKYKKRDCDGTSQKMGEYVDINARGNYYLETKPIPGYPS